MAILSSFVMDEQARERIGGIIKDIVEVQHWYGVRAAVVE